MLTRSPLPKSPPRRVAPALALAALCASGCHRDGDVVRARTFELVDAAGKTRARLQMLDRQRPALTFLDTAGAARAALGLDATGASALQLLDAAGRDRVRVAVTAVGAGIALSDPEGKERARLAMTPEGVPSLGLLDEAGNARIGLAFADKRVGLELSDASGKQRAVLEAPNEGGDASLFLLDAASMPRLRLTASSLLAFGGSPLGLRAVLNVDDDGDARFTVLGPRGGTVVSPAGVRTETLLR